MKRRLFSAVLLFLGSVSAIDAAEVKHRDPAPASLPLVLSDGTQFRLEDGAGKVVVLYFYEQSCPGCAGMVPQRNAWLEKYKGQPVRFVAVGAGDSQGEVQGYINSNKLKLPTAADPLSLTEKSWGLNISLKNIVQIRVIGPDGKVAGYGVGNDFFDRALAQAKWKYEREEYDAAIYPVLDKFEWGDEEAGARLLKQARKVSKKSVAESANKFYEVLKTEAKQAFDEGSGLVESDPVKAYDALTRVMLLAGEEPMAKEAEEKLKTLRKNEAVKSELAARKMLDQLATAVTKARPGQQNDIGTFAKSIIKKYPETPTAKRVEQIMSQWQ